MRRISQILFALTWIGCAASAPRIGRLQPQPPRIATTVYQAQAIRIYLGTAVQEQMLLRGVGIGAIVVSDFRATLHDALRSQLQGRFAAVEFVAQASGDGLLLRLDEFAPEPVKTGNAPGGGGAELRFDITYRAALLKDGREVASAGARSEGRDISWRHYELALMLQHAIERTLADVGRELFAADGIARVGGRIARGGLSPQSSQNSIALMPLHSDGLSLRTVATLDALLAVALNQSGSYGVISTADINAMLQREQMRDLLGCDDVSCAAEIGGALGVKYLLTGSVSRLGSNVIVTLHLIDTVSQVSKARGKAMVKDDEDLYPQAIEEAVKALLVAAQ